MKYIIDIKGEIEGDYEIIGKYEERPMGEMKITEDCINHNAIQIIDENNAPWGMYEANDNADHQRLITMGYVRGVLDMAQAMKEMLNND